MMATCLDCGGRLIPGNAPYTNECSDCGIVYAAELPSADDWIELQMAHQKLMREMAEACGLPLWTFAERSTRIAKGQGNETIE